MIHGHAHYSRAHRNLPATTPVPRENTQGFSLFASEGCHRAHDHWRQWAKILFYGISVIRDHRPPGLPHDDGGARGSHAHHPSALSSTYGPYTPT